MDATGMFVLIIVLAVIIVGGFMTVWMRDQKRSKAVAEDSGRHGEDPSHHRGTGR
jgi:preprotein translocase subunit YajC